MLEITPQLIDLLLLVPLFIGTISADNAVDPADFINESEKDGTPANDNGRVVKLENVDGDDARISPVFFPASIGAVQKIVTDPTDTEIANNTTTETNIISFTLDAGVLSTNNAVRIKTYVQNYSQAGGNNPATFRLKYGSTTIASVVAVVSTGDEGPMKGYIEAIVMADGATGAQIGNLNVELREDSLDPDSPSGVWVRGFDFGTASEDSTGDLTMSLTIQWANASATHDFVPAGITVEKIR